MTALEAMAIALVAAPALVSASYPIHTWLAGRRARARVSDEVAALSVLVPVAGREPGLWANLCAAARQRWEGPYEVVVAGEREDDPSVRVARQVARLYPEVVRVVVSGPPINPPGKVHNVAAAAAQVRGDWLVLLDSDARLAGRGDLAGFASALGDPAVGLVTRVPAYRRTRGWSAVLANLVHTDLAGLFAVQAAWGRLSLANGSCLAIRRDTLERCGGWAPLEGRLLMDSFLARRVRELGLRVALWPRAIEITPHATSLPRVLEQSHRWHAALARGLGALEFAGFAWLRSGVLLGVILYLALPSPAVRVAASAALALRLISALALERLVIRSRHRMGLLITWPLAELAAGCLWMPALLDARVRWRDQWYRLDVGARARAIAPPARGRLASLARALRVSDWIIHLPLVVAVAAIYWSAHPHDAGGFWRSVALALAVQTPLVAAGYWINDFADARPDREKNNGNLRSAAQLRLLGVATGLATAAGLVLAAALPGEKTALVWFTVVAGFAYSLPGARLKERGALGLLAAASLQRLPAFLLIVEWPPREPWVALGLATWLLLLGLLFILEHQIADVDADRRAGVQTWTSQHGRGRAGIVRERLLVALGAVTVLVTALLLARQSPGASLGAVGLAALTLVATRLIARQWSSNRALPRRPTLMPSQRAVRVYGAGLAGLVAAIKMAEWGRRVELCEQRLTPGGMAEGHAFVHSTRQDPERLERWLDLPLAEAFDPVEREAAYVNGRLMRSRALHWNCLRGAMPGALDRLLLDQAAARGVTIRYGAPFRPRAPHEPGTTVLATGHSRIAFEALNIPWEPLEADFAVGPWEGETQLITIRSSGMHSGYGYVASMRGVAFGMVFARGRLTPETCERFRDDLERLEGVRFESWHRLRGASAVETCFERGDFRLAGAAAGMIDPFYLSGVGAALASGGITALAEVDLEEARQSFARLTRMFGTKLALARWVWPRSASRVTLLAAAALEACLGHVGAVRYAPER